MLGQILVPTRDQRSRPAKATPILEISCADRVVGCDGAGSTLSDNWVLVLDSAQERRPDNSWCIAHTVQLSLARRVNFLGEFASIDDS